MLLSPLKGFVTSVIFGESWNMARSIKFVFTRAFWILVCGLSTFGTYLLFTATLDSFSKSPISFVADTSYLRWNTTFPGISVCQNERYNPKYRKFIASHNVTFAIQYFIVFDSKCPGCPRACGPGKNNCSLNFRDVLAEFIYDCETLLRNCSWNGEPFDCCGSFEPFHTEFGVCYSINSIQLPRFRNAPARKLKPKFVSNLVTGPGDLRFQTLLPALVYIHAPEEVPVYGRPGVDHIKAKTGVFNQVLLKVTEVDNDPILAEVPIEERKCRLRTELMENPHYPFYSWSTCIHDCRKNKMMELCGCTPHIFPKVENYTDCDSDQLVCLSEKSKQWVEIRSPIEPQALSCDCLPSCEEPEYSYVYRDAIIRPTEQIGEYIDVQIAINALPSTRYVRTVVRTKLDLVVSMGGAAGLFLGASLLSTVEIIYYCCLYRKSSGKESHERIQKSQPKGTSLQAKVKNGPGSVFSNGKDLGNPGYYPSDYLSRNELFF